MATTADIKNGLCIHYNNDIYQVIEFLHVKPGKGPAFVRTKLRSLTNGRVLDNTFSSGHRIETVRVERRSFQYLYREEAGFVLMDNETFEQVTIKEGLIENSNLMKEGMTVEMLINGATEEPLTAELPATVELEVTYTEPGLKGDTATNTLKPATVETGAEIKVPLFINTGDFVKIDTRNNTYLERVKK
ncbi:MAG: elongation factor P [Bacteroidetes bacterium]|jgi:elongation factor P|nr:elongation factor P [Bacteroidota bacterium]